MLHWKAAVFIQIMLSTGHVGQLDCCMTFATCLIDRENSAQSNHNKPSFEKEVKMAADVLIEQDLFERHGRRKFKSF